MEIVMYKINHFLFLEGSYEINWYEERRRNTRQPAWGSQPKRSDLFFPCYTNPYIGTLRHIAHGQISSRATCDLTEKKNWLLAGCSLGSPTPNRGRVVHRWNAMIFNNIFEKLSDKKWKYNRKILPWHKNILIIWQNSVVLGHIETSMFLMPFSIFEEL